MTYVNPFSCPQSSTGSLTEFVWAAAEPGVVNLCIARATTRTPSAAKMRDIISSRIDCASLPGRHRSHDRCRTDECAAGALARPLLKRLAFIAHHEQRGVDEPGHPLDPNTAIAFASSLGVHQSPFP